VKKDSGGEEKREQDNKKDAMVFGDNVRARKAARALPRTPTQKEKKKEEKKEKNGLQQTHHHPPPFCPNTNHHRHSTMTQP
jgi:hypothetical protein